MTDTSQRSEQRTDTDNALDADTLAARLRDAGHAVSIGGFVDETALAELLGVKPRTVRVWRSLGRGPRAYTFGGSIRYHVADVAAFIASSTANDADTPLADSGK